MRQERFIHKVTSLDWSYSHSEGNKCHKSLPLQYQLIYLKQFY